MRADYGEGKWKQGSEPIALWSHLQEAVASTDRLGIAPQAPATWRLGNIDDPENPGKKKKGWEPVTAQWHEALARIGFDGLIKIALDNLRRDLGLPTPSRPATSMWPGTARAGKG
jgi:hypothetical protein